MPTYKHATEISLAGVVTATTVEATKAAGHLNRSMATGIAKAIAAEPLPPNPVSATVNGQAARLTFPTGYDYTTPLPLFMVWNGIGDRSLNPRAPYAQALADLGVIVAKCDFHGDSYGSPAAMGDAKALYEWALQTYPISGVILHGNSMGGAGALNALTTGAIPGVLGVYLTDAVVSLRHRWDNGRASTIRPAYGIAADGSDYAARTAGHDPNIVEPAGFRGVPIRVLGSSGDTGVPLAEHGQKLKVKLGNQVDLLDTGTAGHNVSDRFVASDLTAYIRKWVGGSAGLPTASVTPAPLNLLFDYDASTLALGAVTEWVPLEGTKSHALTTAGDVAPQAISDPTINATVVRFPDDAQITSKTYLQTGLYAEAITAPLTMFLVVKDNMGDGGTITPAERRYFGGRTATEFITAGAGTDNKLKSLAVGGANLFGANVPSAWTVLAMAFNGTDSWVRVGNTVTAGTASTNAAGILSMLRLGINSAADGSLFKGSMARVIAYDRAMTTAEADVVVTELAVQYGLTLA